MNSWHLQRLRSMTLPELVYRAAQRRQSITLKREMGVHSAAVDFTTVAAILPLTDELFSATEHIDIFGIPVHPAEIRDWSFDVLNKCRFPVKYAKDIDIRTGTSGSAKHVWELNRMLFLPRLALLYRKTRDVHYLTLIMRLVSDWVEKNPYLVGINWYSNIEINIRLINWFLTWEILRVEEIAHRNTFFRAFVNDTWVPSIYQHCKFSYAHPSLHSSANNHLIAEYAGLFVAASKWTFTESNDWKDYAKRGLEREIVQQHSANGINREEAAEYIQFITDFLLIALVTGDNTTNAFSTAFRDRFRSILSYIGHLLTINGQFPKYGDEDDGRVFLLNEDLHDNNFISLLQAGAIYFNDPDYWRGGPEADQKNRLLFGIKAQAASAKSNGTETVRSSKFYPDEGHFIFRKQTAPGREIYCHFDAAPLGYLSIAAHAHADVLSFVVYLDGHPFLIDPGTYCYHTDAEWRHYFVSTRAHNTIGIRGMDQADFVGPTLWLNHYKVLVKDYSLSADYDHVMATHTGYKKCHIQHTRRLEFLKADDKIVITDYIEAKGGKPIGLEMPFHLHPAVDCKLDGHHSVISFADRKVVMQLDSQMQWSVVKGSLNPHLGWYSDRFYKKIPSPVIIGAMPCTSSLQLRTELAFS
ncbi:alginate lyase family protein [Puia sp.]|uniref:alginate lyase family protein n=1 Tax=Puia sp. TaxID=2045100 RepID=UPI002F3F4A55